MALARIGRGDLPETSPRRKGQFSMRPSTWGSELLAVLAAFSLNASPARAQDIPVQSLHDWQYYNDRAHQALARGDLIQAELRFHAAIDLLRPFEATTKRLLA